MIHIRPEIGIYVNLLLVISHVNVSIRIAIPQNNSRASSSITIFSLLINASRIVVYSSAQIFKARATSQKVRRATAHGINILTAQSSRQTAQGSAYKCTLLSKRREKHRPSNCSSKHIE